MAEKLGKIIHEKPLSWLLVCKQKIITLGGYFLSASLIRTAVKILRLSQTEVTLLAGLFAAAQSGRALLVVSQM